MRENMYPKIEIHTAAERRFLQGYPWIYSNEIAASPQNKFIEPGSVVQLCLKGSPLAIGYYNRHSLIAFRVLSRNPAMVIDQSFFEQRLQRALAHRKNFYSEPFYRLVHAEADELPGLIIDRFDKVYSLQVNTQGIETLLPLILSAMQAIFSPETIYIQKNSQSRIAEGLELQEAEVQGLGLSELAVCENGVRYAIDMKNLQKTGWFYDHRDNRHTIASLAKDKTVIDYFCYSGGFALQAAVAGAKKVIGIDRSESAIENAKNSALLNKVEARCEFVVGEAFDDLSKRITQGERYDIVVLDPPAFVKTKKDLTVGLKGYVKLMRQAMTLVAPGGMLFIASCSYHVKEMDLRQCLQKALSKTQRSASISMRIKAGADHPLHPFLEESDYLKGFLVGFHD
jgi:23S rRNA (cytosine1962-C5)-methyltransferase